jgi:hypothetical protein
MSENVKNARLQAFRQQRPLLCRISLFTYTRQTILKMMSQTDCDSSQNSRAAPSGYLTFVDNRDSSVEPRGKESRCRLGDYLTMLLS